MNLVQAGKYFEKERDEILSFSWLGGKQRGNYFHTNSP